MNVHTPSRYSFQRQGDGFAVFDHHQPSEQHPGCRVVARCRYEPDAKHISDLLNANPVKNECLYCGAEREP